MIKAIPLLFLSVIALNSIAQTKPIAYKSHSGDMAYFEPGGTDNLGEIEVMLDSIVIINDSTIVQYQRLDWQETIFPDTIRYPNSQYVDRILKGKGSYYFQGDPKIIDRRNEAKLKEQMEREENSVLPIHLPGDGNDSGNILKPVSPSPYLSILLIGGLITFCILLFFRLKQQHTPFTTDH